MAKKAESEALKKFEGILSAENALKGAYALSADKRKEAFTPEQLSDLRKSVTGATKREQTEAQKAWEERNPTQYKALMARDEGAARTIVIVGTAKEGAAFEGKDVLRLRGAGLSGEGNEKTSAAKDLMGQLDPSAYSLEKNGSLVVSVDGLRSAVAGAKDEKAKAAIVDSLVGAIGDTRMIVQAQRSNAKTESKEKA